MPWYHSAFGNPPRHFGCWVVGQPAAPARQYLPAHAHPACPLRSPLTLNPKRYAPPPPGFMGISATAGAKAISHTFSLCFTLAILTNLTQYTSWKCAGNRCACCHAMSCVSYFLVTFMHGPISKANSNWGGATILKQTVIWGGPISKAIIW